MAIEPARGVATVLLPTSLRALFPGAPKRLEIEAASVVELIDGLDGRWPGMRDRLCHPGPELREFINVYVDGERAELASEIRPGSTVHILPAMAGGSPSLGAPRPEAQRVADER